MKPKTVGRVESGQAPQLRAEILHVGLVAGTILLTSDGEIPVEYLSAGDRIISRNAGLVTLKAVSTTRITSAAVAIAAGSLGQKRPETNVILPAAQQVLVRDWRAKALAGATQAVLPAGCLIDGEFITDLGVRTMTLIQLGFDAPHVVYADGMELSVPAMVTVQEMAA
ncbi:Hint domain-containing protein [Sulfitobacter pseudonitzschiae]|uniref:Hint domain-containing protein n=1 Tax=Pseudosulfitobacter pseudonitzschiae TaxID=1402135 RepID=A0A9Q2NP07_9RHOB|nr:Hint domain-containing protein [Pseudosulfitobacter pseudonitzschiae]MBM2292903.1 Hint domain-containing protein [Pseudosulfitobacter pseudonitzschiae]MBM2298569.1 Hint domain-containing protein [Pseudosulfitobacter pseudonitzschiae]MBM2303483.1 Hint domain-containing protein [Pseudosulfitobacter pseudonitzschiae]MBM2313266.1 Hint domain-containing protein [Pseudosulfitobacter pseudonitzschiae]MBM2318179.1 Hint domain-containing protein [Pseudosulfitobacter pseudonitzschiae]